MPKSIPVIILLTAVGVVVAPSSVDAQTPLIYCTGFVNKVYIHKSGEVFFNPSFRNDYLKLCNVKADWNGVSPIVCQSWLSVIKDVIAGNGTGTGTRMQVTVQYVSTATCANLATYSYSPEPGYVMVVAQ